MPISRLEKNENALRVPVFKDSWNNLPGCYTFVPCIFCSMHPYISDAFFAYPVNLSMYLSIYLPNFIWQMDPNYGHNSKQHKGYNIYTVQFHFQSSIYNSIYF